VISVITATYNRSNVLYYAISSLLRSTYEDWELIVVGDACTDDSEEVVGSFDDPRIRFVNLKENFGDQSGPNNVGAELARGEYIAYLNHDDLYFPDHLGSSLDVLLGGSADFVHSAALRCFPVQATSGATEMRLTLHAVSPSGMYSPVASVPASTWLMRREMINEFGPWKPASQCYGSSSQDLLFRMWRGGARMQFSRHASVLIIPSGLRPKDYINRESQDIRHYFEAMQKEGFRESQLEDIATRALASKLTPRLSPLYHLRSLGNYSYRLMARTLLHVGVGPRDLLRILTFGRKGSFIQYLRKRRGLPPLDAKKQKEAVSRLASSINERKPGQKIDEQ